MFEPPTETPALPPASKPPSWKQRIGSIAVAAAVLASKWKILLALLVKSKVLISGLSVIASVWFYALFFGLPYAIALVALIAVHEFGHVFVIRSAGLPGGMPYFIPGLGAFTTLGARPASAYQSSWIAFGGPLAGGLGAAICLEFGLFTGKPFWLAVANTGFLLNFANLLPIMPFDGGRIVEAVSPRIWVAGLALLIVAMFVFHLFTNPLIVIIVLLSLPQVWKAWKNQLDPAYHDLTMRQRATVAFAYFALAGDLAAGMAYSHVDLPGHAFS